jgi:hypothetical protein
MSVWDTAAMPQLNRRASRRRARRQGAGDPSPGLPGSARNSPFKLGRDFDASLAAASLPAVVGLLLGAFVLGAGRLGVGVEAWLAAAGLAVIVATGLLYALRLGASGPR